MKKGSAVVWTVWIILTILIAGGLVYYYQYTKIPDLQRQIDDLQNQVNQLQEQLNDETAGWETYNLELTDSTFKHPSDWSISRMDPTSSPDQIAGYYINEDGHESDGFVYEYKISKWLEGPDPNEGYVLDKNKRAELLAVMKQIYSDRDLTETSEQALDDFGVEFLTYSGTDRIYVGYVESRDGNSRGLAMINQSGQDIGLTADYTVTLYNQEKDAVLKIYYKLSGKEIDDLRARYEGRTDHDKVNQEVHSAFEELVKNTARGELSFGVQMDTVDKAAKSWSF